MSQKMKPKTSSKCVTIQVETASAAQARPSPQTTGFPSKNSTSTPVKKKGLLRVFEKTWVWVFSTLLVASLAFSVVSLARDSSDWLVSSHESSNSRVGWRKGCVDRVLSDSTEQKFVPCSANDSPESLETMVNTTAHTLGQSLFIATFIVWLLPVLLILCSSWFDVTRGTCCHGFSISLLWGVGGIALFAMGLLFWSVVNDESTSNESVRWSVTCTTDFFQELPVCSDVSSLTTCPTKCRLHGDDVVCVGFSHCHLHEREATCELDGVGCEMRIGWALYLSLTGSALMTISAAVLAPGAWTVSKHL